MSMQKKVWIGAAVLIGLALLAPPLTAYANRQREAAEAANAIAPVYDATGAQQRALEASKAPAATVPVYDATGAMQGALDAGPAPTPGLDWDAERARMTAEPGYTPAGARPTAVPAP